MSIKYSNDDTNSTVHYTRLMDASKYDSVALVNAKILSDCSKASKQFAGTTPPSSIPPYKTRFHNSSIAVWSLGTHPAVDLGVGAAPFPALLLAPLYSSIPLEYAQILKSSS